MDNQIEDFKVMDRDVADDVQEKINSMPKDISEIPMDEAIKNILESPNFKLDPSQQYKRGGKLYQRIAKYRSHRNTRRLQFISVVVDHTPDSKYTGEILRALRKERGIGRIKG